MRQTRSHPQEVKGIPGDFLDQRSNLKALGGGELRTICSLIVLQFCTQICLQVMEFQLYRSKC